LGEQVIVSFYVNQKDIATEEAKKKSAARYAKAAEYHQFNGIRRLIYGGPLSISTIYN
jgi:hypothetical protein